MQGVYFVSLKIKHINYKWIILVACFLMEFLCLGFCSSNPGLYTAAVTTALDIPRSLYAIGTSIRYIVQVVVALFFGPLIQRFGLKKLVGVGLFSLCASVLAKFFTTNIIHHYIACVLWGLGIVFSGGTMASTIVRRWFHKDVGKLTGIVMSANGIGGAVSAQIISPLINNGETFGYRKAYLLSAIILAIISIIILLLLKENPAPAVAADKSGKKPRGLFWTGMDFSNVLKKSYFYLTIMFIFLTGISMQSVGSIGIVYMEDLGLDKGFVAITATISSLVLTIAKIATGFTYDKKGLRFTLLMCQTCVVIGFILMATLQPTNLGMVFAVIATVLTTIALPLETVMLPLISSELFGSASHTKVLGVYMAANSLGLCLGSPLCDIYRDLSGGSYVSCYWFFAGLMILVGIGFQLVISTAKKDKKKLLAEI